MSTDYSQPGIFNVLDYGMKPGQQGIASDNQKFLQQAIYDAEAAGGTVLIPSEYQNQTEYRINGPIYIGSATVTPRYSAGARMP